jgi:hypothetical protein
MPSSGMLCPVALLGSDVSDRNQSASGRSCIGKLDQGFPLFSSVPGQMLIWYPNSTKHCILHMQSSKQ